MPEIAMPIAEQWDGQTYYTDANGRVVGQQECIVKLNHYWRQLQLAQTEIKGHMRVEDELRAEIARHSRILFEPLGDNHHNAWACPYCNPHIEEQRSKLAQAQARIAELEKERDELKHHIAVTEALKGRA